MKSISKVATHPPTRFLHCCEKFMLHSLVTGKDREVKVFSQDMMMILIHIYSVEASYIQLSLGEKIFLSSSILY